MNNTLPSNPYIESVVKEFIWFEGMICVRREGMGEYDYRPAEIRDIENKLTLAMEEGRRIGRADLHHEYESELQSRERFGEAAGRKSAVEYVRNRLSCAACDSKVSNLSHTIWCEALIALQASNE